MEHFAKMKDFAGPEKEKTDGNLEPAFKNLAKALNDLDLQGLFAMRIIRKDSPLDVSFTLKERKCTVEFKKKMKEPDLELITREETAWEILRGNLSPLSAFLQGNMRIRGDAELGKKILHQVASSAEARFDVCEGGI